MCRNGIRISTAKVSTKKFIIKFAVTLIYICIIHSSNIINKVKFIAVKIFKMKYKSYITCNFTKVLETILSFDEIITHVTLKKKEKNFSHLKTFCKYETIQFLFS